MPTVWARTLRRAAELVGGEFPLAAKMNVRPSDLAAWLRGEANPPAEVFLKAADIIGAHDLEQLGKRPPSQPPMR